VLAEFDGLAAIVTNGVNRTIKEALEDGDQTEALDVATRLATGLRSVSFIAMGTFDASEQERTRSLSQKLEDFARTVAHELRGPLQTMTIGLELLRRKFEGQEDAIRQVEALEEAAARSAALIDSMLVLAIAEQARSKTHLVALDETVTELNHQFAEKARERGVKLQFEKIPDIKVERALIEIVLANLIGNAIKYSDPNKEMCWVCLDARLVPEESDSGFCEIKVSDNGLGIPEEFLPRVCQRGFRAHPEHAQGTGLGLYIVQQLLTERGGSIKVESVEGQGSIVTVRLRGLVGDCSALMAEDFDINRLMGEAARNRSDSDGKDKVE
jgi:signal transduction histidine kinase